MKPYLNLLSLLLAISFFTACNSPCEKAVFQDKQVYYVSSSTKPLELEITDWYVAGALPFIQDSLLTDDFAHLPSMDLRDIITDTASHHRYNGYYHPQYGQMDLKEVYGIEVTDTTNILDSLATYLSCTVVSEEERDLFLYVRTEMECREYLNGDTLPMMPFKEMEVYPVHLLAGENMLTVRTQGTRRGAWYEAILCDSTSMRHRYSMQHTGDIVFPVIKGDSIHLTERHWLLAGSMPELFFHDVSGREVACLQLEKGILDYHTSGMEENHAYICSMVLGGDTIRQPVMTGTADIAGQQFKRLRDSIPASHPRIAEIDQVLYRLWKLQSVTGNMRKDRWYEFKLPWVIYQLEHTFAHLDCTYGNDDSEYNFKFITYRSKLDDGLQRYILVTPNTVERDKEYPLVVVVRPCNEKRYHLFFCPQIAHQHIVNDMQALANEYGCFIIMPEARMLLDEDLIPFAEAEMKLAIDDVCEHYRIDNSRIFLHANCSGGYRALRMAENNPDMFAGIALYAPVYKRSESDNVYMDGAPAAMLDNLRGTPLFIFGDPVDTHSPFSIYESLVEDCKRRAIPVQLALRRNTGQGYHGYHRHVVGKEACEFFKDKKKEHRNRNHYKKLPSDTTIADFYSKPFIYVYNADDTSAVYKEVVENIRKEYESYLYSKLPLVPDTRVTRKMLREKNIFLIGNSFSCYHVNSFAEDIIKESTLEVPEDRTVTLSVFNKPYGWDGKVLLYTADKNENFNHVINYPWKRGFRRSVTKRLQQSSINEETTQSI